MMVHTDKKHFRCCACPAQFKGRENLRKHVAKFHHDLLNNANQSMTGGVATKGETSTEEGPKEHGKITEDTNNARN